MTTATPSRMFQYHEALLNLQRAELGRRGPPTSQRPDPRTFSVERRADGHSWVTLHQHGDAVVTVEADPLHSHTDVGGVTISVGFPCLIVAPCVKDPEAFAAHVARLLTNDGTYR